MKAIVCRRSGSPDVLTLEDIDQPVGARTLRHLVGVRVASVGASQRVVLFIAKLKQADLLGLRDEVPEALRDLRGRRANGKLVSTV